MIIKTKHPQIVKEIKWLLLKLRNAKGLEKKKYIQKVENWMRAHPFEAEQIVKQVTKDYGLDWLKTKKAMESRNKIKGGTPTDI